MEWWFQWELPLEITTEALGFETGGIPPEWTVDAGGVVIWRAGSGWFVIDCWVNKFEAVFLMLSG